MDDPGNPAVAEPAAARRKGSLHGFLDGTRSALTRLARRSANRNDAEAAVARPVRQVRDVPARVIAGAAVVCAVGALAIVGFDRSARTPVALAASDRVAAGALDVPAGATPDEAALLMTTDYLTTALGRSGPFETELAVALRLVGDRSNILPLLDELILYAETGVPSRAELMAAFEAEARKIEGDGPGAMLGWMESSLNGLIQFNRAALRREEAFRALRAEVAAGDLAAATVRLSRLDGAARQALDGWLEAASTRVKVDAIGAELNRLAHLEILGEAG